MDNKINIRDISIIIQGPIYDCTKQTLKNVRHFFPDAELILSTWNNQNTTGLDADIIVKSEDPGGGISWDNPVIYHAANRQIVGVYAGLKNATRTYALKIRTDMYFENVNFLNYMNKYEKRCEKYKILKERVLLSTSFALNPRRDPKPFHPSDWFFFGLTEDLLNIFNSKLLPEPESSQWFRTRQRPICRYDAWFPAYCRYQTEQYIWLAFVMRNSDVICNDTYDISDNNIEKSEIIFANNSVLLDASKIRYSSYKYKKMHKLCDLSLMYSHREWLQLYKKYCDSKIKIPLFDWEKIRRCYWALKMKRKGRIKFNLKSLFELEFKKPFKNNSNT